LSESRARRFLLDALDLIATFLHGEPVVLGEVAVGARDEGGDMEFDLFAADLSARHALACAVRLRPIISAIAARSSSTTAHRREESLGAIRGRLDVPRYIALRTQNVSLPRRYPVQTLWRTPETPENALAVVLMEALGRQLAYAPFPIRTAEGAAAASAYAEVRRRLRQVPWVAVRRRDSAPRLVREVEGRLARRQTGNDDAYRGLLEWYVEWAVDARALGTDDGVRIADGLVAFPTTDAFWERVFEIWCLRETAESLVRQGFAIIEGPRSLHDRTRGPIYRLSRESAAAEIWFQRQKPLGDPRWRYKGGGPLTGIPDIVVTVDYRSPLVVDAKYRTMTTDTRSEETYKILGYAENFRSTTPSVGFAGLLIFPGPTTRSTHLEGPTGGQLSVIAVEPLSERAEAESAIDAAIAAWLTA
jgi:hypothetical protein